MKTTFIGNLTLGDTVYIHDPCYSSKDQNGVCFKGVLGGTYMVNKIEDEKSNAWLICSNLYPYALCEEYIDTKPKTKDEHYFVDSGLVRLGTDETSVFDEKEWSVFCKTLGYHYQQWLNDYGFIGAVHADGKHTVTAVYGEKEHKKDIVAFIVR